MTDKLLDDLIKEIESWDRGDQIRISLANDGDGHFDFMGFTVTERGRASLVAVIEKHLART
jgi:hypothetical protein